MNFEVIPFLSLNGQAAAAIAFYEEYLGAKVIFKKTYQEMKEMVPNFRYEAGKDDYITHSVLKIGRNKLMIAEEEMDTTQPWQHGNSYSLCIQSKDYNEIDKLYGSLTKHKEVTVLAPFEKNSFSPGYGIIRDPFGVVIQLCVTVHDF